MATERQDGVDALVVDVEGRQVEDVGQVERQLKAHEQRYESVQGELEQTDKALAVAVQRTGEYKDEAAHYKRVAEELREQLAEYGDGPSPERLDLDARRRHDARLKKRRESPPPGPSAQAQQNRLAETYVHSARMAEAEYGGNAKDIFKRWSIETGMMPDDAEKPSISDIAKTMKSERLKKSSSNPSSDRANLNANRSAPSPMKGGKGQGADFPATREGMLAFLEATEGE